MLPFGGFLCQLACLHWLINCLAVGGQQHIRRYFEINIGIVDETEFDELVDPAEQTVRFNPEMLSEGEPELMPARALR